jgi:hypothetical protein
VEENIVIRPCATFAALALAGLTGCTDAERAQRAAYGADRPADVTCRTFGEPFYVGRSTGKVTYDEGGRVTFVDRANGRLTTIEGECMIVYARGGA